jgi:uncharacterized membrane protein YeaQ/YmgE (transglycosylase-associated protein family)
MLIAVVAAAAVALEPGGLLSWLVVGLIAGALAGRVVEGRGLGCLGDIVVGIVGAVLGGLIVGQLGLISGSLRFFGTLVVAFFGAVVFLALIRLVSGSRRR